MKRRVLAIGGIVGPAAFVAAWVVLGARKTGYNPIEDHISRLAAQGVPERPAMTAGFLAFGVSLPLYSLALRSRLGGYAWATAAATGIATVAVAAFPLDGPVGDTAHAVAAGSGYATLAATPLLAALPLHRLGRVGWSRASLVAGSVSAGCLVGHDRRTCDRVLPTGRSDRRRRVDHLFSRGDSPRHVRDAGDPRDGCLARRPPARPARWRRRRRPRRETIPSWPGPTSRAPSHFVLPT